MISGGLSKIQTADNVIGIFTSRAMRERGRYQIQLMKTRSSSGVGSKVDLEFDVDTLRIMDCEQDESGSGGSSSGGSASSIVAALQRKNTNTTVNADAPDEGIAAPKIKAEVDSTKLRQFLNNLGSD
jgi:hypothetical protein